MRKRGIGGPVLVVLVVLVLLGTGIWLIARPGAEAAGATAVTCLGGSEKSGLMGDAEVKRILRERFGLEPSFRERGSYAQVRTPAEQLRADGLDCLWPSSFSAQAIFEGASSDAFPEYRAEPVLQSPEVLYANREVADGLLRSGIVARRDDAYFIVDMRRLLEELILQRRSWADIGVAVPAGPIIVGSSDPAKSNSGMTLAQLELAILATGDPYRPATAEQAKAALPRVRALIEAQGLLRPGSDSAFDQWLIQGTGGLLAGYENQLLQWAAWRGGRVPEQIVTLYPEPTILNEHPILALTPNGRRFAEAMRDGEIQAIAGRRYGFRPGSPDLEQSLGQGLGQAFPGVALPATAALRKTQAPNQEVTGLLLRCFETGQC
ncbi:hypothetical protein AB0H71_33570 [Nocardia sp. NPDC050697]|uniref:hypothetical protein n=1 Tax=Nocardia sp. NPDC050697 TaxID=3155158 RepID=UPI0033CAB895